MNYFVYIIVGGVRFFLYALELMMFARAILSWIIPETDSPIVGFLVMMTEPVIFPIRALLSRIEAFNAFPIDISFMVAYMLLVFLSAALPNVAI
ncbi:MAG: YggT family protein [Clostridia bacterium]|nr:YggT family protein [Clostridia bacterium]